MKAIVIPQYGPPDVLQLAEIDKPIPKDNEILIRVHAASVNPLDFHGLRGKPAFTRLQTGLLKPRNPRLGVDLAGTVEAVGKDVTRFRPGDEVFGARNGAFAEYVVTVGKALATKPANATSEQAAAVPVAGFTALQGLRDKGQIRPGHKVLINGAAGGVGTFAVQIAKAFGADVTGVTSTPNLDLVRGLGVERVIDYTREDYTAGQSRYDLLFDCVGNHSLSANRRILSPGGIHVLVGGTLARVLQAAALSRLGRRDLVFFIAQTNNEDLTVLKELIEAGQVTPVIDRVYPLAETAAALRYSGEKQARGKVVVTLA